MTGHRDEQGEGVLNEAAWADCSIPLLTLKHGLGVASDGWLLYQMESTGGWRRWGSERGVDVRRELIAHLARPLAAARRDLAAVTAERDEQRARAEEAEAERDRMGDALQEDHCALCIAEAKLEALVEVAREYQKAVELELRWAYGLRETTGPVDWKKRSESTINHLDTRTALDAALRGARAEG